jgi:putative transposase
VALAEKQVTEDERLRYSNRIGCRGMGFPTALQLNGNRRNMDSITNLRTVYFRCELPRSVADALNRESGRVYTQVMVEQYRIYRKRGVWLSPNAQKCYNDYLNDQPAVLHSHSIDAAQEGFPKACKTAQANRAEGAHYPHKRKYYRTTIWKHTAIRLRNGTLLLSLARGSDPIPVELPANLHSLPTEAFTEMRLVYNKASRHYEWHLVVADGEAIKPTKDTGVAAIDLGEIHPATITDGLDAAVISCRELRSLSQHTNKRLSKFQQKQSGQQKGSKRWKKIQRRKARFLAKQERRRRDLEHKVSRAVVNWAEEHSIGTLAIGDVREVASGKRLHRKSQQKLGSWSHGRMRTYIGYKATAKGIAVADDINEAYTSQTCVGCGNRHKPKGRFYKCPACGAVVHRDVQGAANLLSRHLYGELEKVSVIQPKYRHPVLRGKRSAAGHAGNGSP